MFCYRHTHRQINQKLFAPDHIDPGGTKNEKQQIQSGIQGHALQQNTLLEHWYKHTWILFEGIPM